MKSATSACGCSILDTREEKLLLEESRIEIRMVCNRCGVVLDRRHHDFDRPQKALPGGKVKDLAVSEGS